MRRLRFISIGLVLAGAVGLGQGGWIWAKAQLAQLLLEHAWVSTRAGEEAVKPWPWADTSPVARLRAPAHGVDLIVLQGATGRTLAFGPGHLDGSATPGSVGNAVISGHRDTHFRFLADVAAGETIELEDAAGTIHRFRVRGAEVVDSRDSRIRLTAERPQLTLVTCWPFGAVVPGGPLRYVVYAEEETSAESSANT